MLAHWYAALQGDHARSKQEYKNQQSERTRISRLETEMNEKLVDVYQRLLQAGVDRNESKCEAKLKKTAIKSHVLQLAQVMSLDHAMDTPMTGTSLFNVPQLAKDGLNWIVYKGGLLTAVNARGSTMKQYIDRSAVKPTPLWVTTLQ
ncbi:hypothetical protein EDB19DRAFT_1904790 [Suillus lakei]|nr:hypothetical protein EDB19DRAFT_1904790 [Suillus lakei]